MSVFTNIFLQYQIMRRFKENFQSQKMTKCWPVYMFNLSKTYQFLENKLELFYLNQQNCPKVITV